MRNMPRAFRILLAAACACALAACGVTSPSDLAMDTFSGSVAPGSQSAQFSFKQAKTGEFVVKVTSVTPDSAATLLFNYGGAGSVNGVAGCGVTGSFPAQQGISTDTQLPAGDYCAFMSDPGVPAIPRSENFTVTVSHR
jgi:hypothetical protein